jgi:Mor family transcriptional regulator
MTSFPTSQILRQRLKRRTELKQTPEQITDKIVTLYKKGHSVKGLSQTFRWSQNKINLALISRHVVLRRRYQQKQKTNPVNINVPEAQLLYRQGKTLRQLGAKYKCSHESIRRTLLKRKPNATPFSPTPEKPAQPLPAFSAPIHRELACPS